MHLPVNNYRTKEAKDMRGPKFRFFATTKFKLDLNRLVPSIFLLCWIKKNHKYATKL